MEPAGVGEGVWLWQRERKQNMIRAIRYAAVPLRSTLRSGRLATSLRSTYRAPPDGNPSKKETYRKGCRNHLNPVNKILYAINKYNAGHLGHNGLVYYSCGAMKPGEMMELLWG